jgi:hypothetical protein
MANQLKVDELNAAEDKGYMYFGGKDFTKKNRITISFENEQHAKNYMQQERDIYNGVSIDVPY